MANLGLDATPEYRRASTQSFGNTQYGKDDASDMRTTSKQCGKRVLGTSPMIILASLVAAGTASAQTSPTAGGSSPGFSLAQIVITACAALVFSGVGGALFQKWLGRARPKLQITSIGFTGTQDLIKLEDDLINRSEKDSWGPTLRRFEPFSELAKRDQSSAEMIERLRKAIAIGEDWLGKYPSRPKSSTPTLLQLDEVRNHPYMRDDTVGAALHGLCRRDELGTPPFSLPEIQKSPRLTDLTKREKEWHLFLGRFGVAFPLEDMPSDARAADMELMAESFARGIRENICHYTTCFIDESKKDLLALGELRDHLSQTMVPQAHLSVTGSFYNGGKTATALRPHMGLRILHEKLRGQAFILSNIHSEEHEEPDPIRELLQKADKKPRRGKHVVVKGILPETSSTPYISIAPGQVYQAQLIATDPMGKDNGERLKDIYNTGLLKCQMVAQTISGKQVWSKPTDFSSGVTDASRATLKALLQKKRTG